MTGPSTTASIASFLPKYWDTVLGENLYPNLYFYQFGTKRRVPRNFGKTILIPRLQKKNIVSVVATEGSPIATCGISGTLISGTMVQYAGAYKHSDVLMMTALSDVVELSLIDISRDIARRMDRSIRNALTGTGVVISSTNPGVFSGLKPAAIIRAVVTLDAGDNPRPADNHYPTIIHPKTAYDIQTNLSGGAWLDVIKYTNNVERAYVGEIGRLYGARFVTSNNIRRRFLSTTTSGTESYMLAPNAYYVTEINEMTARTYVKQLGSAGTADPVNQVATVGAKVFFGVVPVNWTTTEYRIVRLKYTNTIDGGAAASTAGDTTP